MKKFNTHEIENSIQAEIDLIQLIIKKPHNYFNDTHIKSALSNQKNMAYYSNHEYGILSLSLNTHKLYVNKYSNITYSQYNELRINASLSLKTSSNYKSNKFQKLKIENNNLKINNLILIKIIYDLKATILNLALKSNNKYTISDIENKLKGFEKLLSSSTEMTNYE